MFALRLLFGCALAISALAPRAAHAADRTFPAGSLIIPMDLSYQSRGHVPGLRPHLSAAEAGRPRALGDRSEQDVARGAVQHGGRSVRVGLRRRRLGREVRVSDGEPRLYRDDEGDLGRRRQRRARHDRSARTAIAAGRSSIDAADHDAALAIIDVWNDQAKWAANPWAMRTVFHVVDRARGDRGVHRQLGARDARGADDRGVRRRQRDIATGYLRAAGIPQSNGTEFPAAKCGASELRPGHGEPRHAHRGSDRRRPRHVRRAEPQPQERRAVQSRTARPRTARSCRCTGT